MTDMLTNPLLDVPGLNAIGQWLSDTPSLMRKLKNNPVPSAGNCSIPYAQRRDLISAYRKIFVPTPQALRIADQIIRLLRNGLESRNPCLPRVQRWINSTQQWLNRPLEGLPWNPVQAQGMIIEGITGMGKSHVVDRILYLLPQVVDHEPGGQWGMLRLRHLVWLKVHMPADHSRKGLLVAILTEMDIALDTDYFRLHVNSRASVEILMVKVMYLLVQHRCGMLIIEEAQSQNIGNVTFSRDFLNFFLRILNWGVPIVIVGNPQAFVTLKNHAQDVDRFSEGGWFSLLPEFNHESDIWRRLWIPGLWNPSLLDKPDAEFVSVEKFPSAHDWPSLIWSLTGGIPRQVKRLRAEVMDYALVARREVINVEFVIEVFENSPRFEFVKSRNIALANHDIKGLMAFEDIPLDHLRRHWHQAAESSIGKGNVQPKIVRKHLVNQPGQDSEIGASEKDSLCEAIKTETRKAQARRLARKNSPALHDGK